MKNNLKKLFGRITGINVKQGANSAETTQVKSDFNKGRKKSYKMMENLQGAQLR